MKKRTLIIFFIPLLAIVVSWTISETECALRKCVNDFASRTAVAAFGPVILAFYYIFTAVVVDISITASKNTDWRLASLLVPAVISTMICWLLYRPGVDSIARLSWLYGHISVPLVATSMVANYLLYRGNENT